MNTILVFTETHPNEHAGGQGSVRQLPHDSLRSDSRIAEHQDGQGRRDGCEGRRVEEHHPQNLANPSEEDA